MIWRECNASSWAASGHVDTRRKASCNSLVSIQTNYIILIVFWRITGVSAFCGRGILRASGEKSRIEFFVPMGNDRRGFIHIQRVVVDQRETPATCATTKSASSDARRQRIVRTNVMGL